MKSILLFVLTCNLAMAGERLGSLQDMKVDSTKKADTINVWIPSMVTALNLSQIAFSNWTQGGSNSLSWNFIGNVGYNYVGTDWSLRNHARVAYGKTKLGNQGSITTDNELFLENVLTYKLGWVTDPFFSNTILTTLTEGYSYKTSTAVPIADFFDPGYVTQSIGVSYDNLTFFTTRAGLAAQEIFANKFRSQYTDDPTTVGVVEASKIEVGLESVSQAKFQVADNILFTSGLRLFTRFKHVDVWDVRWDNLIAARVSSHVNVSFVYQLVYQKDQSLTTQMKEGLQLGAAYTIF